MTDKTVLTGDQINAAYELNKFETDDGSHSADRILFERGVTWAVRTVLLSEPVQAWRRDTERLDWLLNNLSGFHAILFNGVTPLMYRGRHLKSADALRGEINAAMEQQT